MKKQSHSVAPIDASHIEAPTNGIKLWIPDDLKARPDRPFVAHTESESAGAKMLIVALGFDIFMGIAIYLGFRYLADAPAAAAFILALLGVTAVAILVLFLLSGDLPALYEIRRSGRTEDKRIEAAKVVYLGQIDVLKIHAQAQRTGERARLLEAKNEEATIKHAMLTAHQAHSIGNQLAGYEAPEHFVPADPMPDPAYMAVLGFVGRQLFDNVDPQTGRIKCAVPWGKTGGLSAADAERVAEWIKVVNNKAPKGAVFVYEKQAWHVNLKSYPTAWLVSEALKREPLLKAN